MDTVSTSSQSGTVASVFACTREGLDTARQQLPTLLKLAIPYIALSSLATFFLVDNSQLLASKTAASDLQDSEMTRYLIMTFLKSTALFLLIVLPFSVFTSFAILRLASCEPLPAPESQRASSLWRFELRFLRYFVLLICQSISSLIFVVPGALVGFVVGAVLFFLPDSIAQACAQIPAMYMLALWGGFFVVSSMKFLGTREASIGESIRSGLSSIRTNISLWSRLAVIGLVAMITMDFINYILAAALTSLSMANLIASTALTMIVYIPMLFIYRAGYKTCA